MQYAPTKMPNMPFSMTIFRSKKSESTISHNHFPYQKKGHTISHNQKIDLRYSSFLLSGQGHIEYAPHVSGFLIIRRFLRCLERAYAIRAYRNTCYVVSHNNFSDQKKVVPFRIILFRFKQRDNRFYITIFRIKKRVMPFHIT